MTKSDPETYTEAETEARREAALQHMFATPHKPHKIKAMKKADKPGASRKER